MGLMKHCSILRAQIFAAINIHETYVSEIYFRDFEIKFWKGEKIDSSYKNFNTFKDNICKIEFHEIWQFDDFLWRK